MARKNIRSGPINQFWARESVRIFQFRKTSASSSYRTLAKGGYIIRIKPTAIGIDVEPIVSELVKSEILGQK